MASPTAPSFLYEKNGPFAKPSAYIGASFEFDVKELPPLHSKLALVNAVRACQYVFATTAMPFGTSTTATTPGADRSFATSYFASVPPKRGEQRTVATNMP